MDTTISLPVRALETPDSSQRAPARAFPTGSEALSDYYASPNVRRYQPGSRPQPITYIGAQDDNAFICEASQFIWQLIYAHQRTAPGQKFLLGVSGGTTPQKVFCTLAKLSTSCRNGPSENPSSCSVKGLPCGGSLHGTTGKIDWSEVLLFLIDERYVPADHPDSNLRMVCETLLSPDSGIVIPPSHLIVPNTSLPLDECVADYDAKIRTMVEQYGVPHLVILGMGIDGHIASWFPPLKSSEEARTKTAWVSHVQQNRFAVPDRITVSMNLLCSATDKLFLLKGEDKVAKWKELLTLDPLKNIQREPVLQILASLGVACISCPPAREGWSRPITGDAHVSIIILGGSGDLAKKKTIPALFSLFCEGYMPENFSIVGYARTKMSTEAYWEMLQSRLLRLDAFFRGAQFAQHAILADESLGFLERFRRHLTYVSGAYDAPADFARLNSVLSVLEYSKGGSRPANRMFYLALPPNVFHSAISCSKLHCWSPTGWNRVVIEKPFGKDYDSAMQLASNILSVIQEEEAFRIDHYLGKEMVLNLTILRFANAFLGPLMSEQYVSAVRITFKEEIGTEGRGGYFDQYGIIRDIMQNHLLQVLSIVAMERPATLSDDDIRDEKVKVLKCIPPILVSETVVGQYGPSISGDRPGYLDDPDVRPGSRCPSFCTAVLRVNNGRWAGVPFIMKAGKALEERLAEIRVQFRPVPGNLFGTGVPQNELVVKIQPNEAIYMKVLTKAPGLLNELHQTELDFTMTDRVAVGRLPDAYERLLLDVLKGDKQNFVRTDELREAWRIFTPALRELEENVQPLIYPAGSTGPPEAYDLINNVGYKRFQGFYWG